MLIYCDSYAVCGRRFFLYRYRDGDILTSIQQLIQPRIRRPYSHRRRLVNVELRPVLFYRAAIKALSALHDSSLPMFMRQQEEQQRRRRTGLTRLPVHPLLRHIQQSINRYRLYVETSKTIQRENCLKSVVMEALAQRLLSCFDSTILSQQNIPPPSHEVILHGNFDLSSVIFSHRSLEGRAKYPP